MKQYKTYKNSGIKSIGEIPHHWGIEPFGRHFSYGKGLPITKANLIPDGIAVISYGQIHSKINTGTKMSKELVRFVSPDYLKSNPQSLLKPNDFIFADTSEDIEGCGNCSFNDFDDQIFAGYHTVVARPINLSYPKYYAYLFQSKSWKNQVQSLVNGVKVYSINKGILKKSVLLFPPLAEQEAIVKYLDEKTAKIDKLVAQVEREIELLKEYKQAEIARVVTKGLNPNAPMKPSGISWIGEIPQHWNIRKLFQVATSYYESNKGMKNQNLLSLSYGAIIQKDINKTDGLLPASFETYQIVQPNIIVLRLTDLQNDHKSLRVGISKYEGIVTSAYEALKVREPNNADYVYYQLHTNDIHKVFYGMGNGLRQNLNYAGMKYMNLVVPPTEEQQEIVKYIDHKTTEIDRLVAELTYQVEYLKEYKQRLIADVVTGKINVQPE